MRLTITTASEPVGGRLGPVCIACGNTRRFRVAMGDRDTVVDMQNLPNDAYTITACGRCGAKHSILNARVA